MVEMIKIADKDFWHIYLGFTLMGLIIRFLD
jgi:hypothetical protein